MKVLVTGNLGYIGSVLAPLLESFGHEVVGFDIDYYKGCDFDTQTFRGKQIIKDIRDIEKDDVTGFDAVIHLANISNDPMGELNPDITYVINHKATVRLAEVARAAGVKRFIYSSTQSVYGNSGGEVVTEKSEVAPLTAYAKSKYMSEKDIGKMKTDTFSPVFMRPTTVCGVSPRLRCDLLINAMTSNAVSTKKIYVYSDHDVWRASLHIEDVSSAFMSVLTANKETVSGEVFNVGGNEDNHTTKEIAQMVAEVTDAEQIFTNELGKDTRSYKSNYDKILQHIPSFKPRWDTISCIRSLKDAYVTKNMSPEKESHLHRLKTLKKRIENKTLDDNLRVRS